MKHFLKLLLHKVKDKDIMFKVGHQKKCAVSVNKESMNRIGSENIRLRF